MPLILLPICFLFRIALDKSLNVSAFTAFQSRKETLRRNESELNMMAGIDKLDLVNICHEIKRFLILINCWIK